MSNWCTRLHLLYEIRHLNVVRMVEGIQVREFLGICSSSNLHPLRQVSTPEATEEADGWLSGWGGGVTQMFTHGVGPPNPPLQPQATYPRPSETLQRCILTACLTITQRHDTHEAHLNVCVCVSQIYLWLKATRRGEAFLTLSHPAGFPLTDTDKQ